ncbi:MAG: glycerol-3-phosphate responsive antiterminator [Lachnospiraceae bacterium]|nr:glycerol-3-phosphate responsive antiterminator [Lachnospiraceae bacterium]
MIRFKHPTVIAAVRTEADFVAALASESRLIFDLMPGIRKVKERTDRAHQAGKKLFLHMDLVEGIGKDAAGLEYVQEQGADGIISTRAGMIRQAKEIGLLTVQRFFMVDSQSVRTAEETLKTSKADMIEVMPGLLPKVIAKLAASGKTPVIAGGLIETAEEIRAAFAAGASAVSTAKAELWKNFVRFTEMGMEE